MSQGKVYLVGAGPGDPGLLTLRGQEMLSQADLVLYDGLVNPLLLQFASGTCERTARTSVGSDRIVPQSEINDRLVAEARAGRTVVRLKGGDPYIFGRGSEEATALDNAGIPYEIVPGITAATAAGVYAGFSFTHRDIASAVAFVTGHEDPTRTESRLDYEALARFPGTLVFYMGLGRLQTICHQLIAAGKSADTPASVICRASLPSQKVVSSTLKSLAAEVEQAALKPPSLIVVGDCVNLRTTESWFEQRPLFGLNIGVPRPRHQCHAVAKKITALSGQPVIMPLIAINPADTNEQHEFQQLAEDSFPFDWLVFTSTNGVHAFFDQLWALGHDVRQVAHLKIAAIGPSTAAALEERSLKPDVIPEAFRAEALAEAMAEHVKDQRVLWARASRGRDVLPSLLRKAEASVTEIVVYHNEDIETFDHAALEMLRNETLHWIGISSPSIARQLAKLLSSSDIDLTSLTTKIASISPVTTAAAKEAGLPVALEATDYTWNGILAAISRTTR